MEVKLSPLSPGRFTSGVKAPATHWMGGWVGPTVGLDAVAKGKKILPLSGIEPRSSSPLILVTNITRLVYRGGGGIGQYRFIT